MKRNPPPLRAALSFVAHFARSAKFATISASGPSTPSTRIVTLSIR